MLSIHNNLLAGTQNVTGAYVIITLFVQGYNLEVHNVINSLVVQ